MVLYCILYIILYYTIISYYYILYSSFSSDLSSVLPIPSFLLNLFFLIISSSSLPSSSFKVYVSVFIVGYLYLLDVYVLFSSVLISSPLLIYSSSLPLPLSFPSPSLPISFPPLFPSPILSSAFSSLPILFCSSFSNIHSIRVGTCISLFIFYQYSIIPNI